MLQRFVSLACHNKLIEFVVGSHSCYSMGSLLIIPSKNPTPLNFNLIWKQQTKGLCVECAKANSLFIDCLIYLLLKKNLVLLTAQFPLIITVVTVSKKILSDEKCLDNTRMQRILVHFS